MFRAVSLSRHQVFHVEHRLADIRKSLRCFTWNIDHYQHPAASVANAYLEKRLSELSD